jgi:hypothetical protein
METELSSERLLDACAKLRSARIAGWLLFDPSHRFVGILRRPNLHHMFRANHHREWWEQFARHLREQGIEANATERAVRGESRTHKLGGIFRATQRGPATHMRERVELSRET